MSDIVNNALPSAEKLAEPIYYITWRAPIGGHMAESPGVGASGIGQVLPFKIPLNLFNYVFKSSLQH